MVRLRNHFDLKVQMKCFFIIAKFEEQQKSGRSPFTVSYYLF